MVLNNQHIDKYDAKCVISGTDCMATSTGKCRLYVSALAMAVDNCCCPGSNGFYVNGTFVPLDDDLEATGSADIGCNNNGAVASLKMSCLPGGPALAEVSYTLGCSPCRAQ
jgi:hypothetical protein